ncbi:MAG: type II toxin-antitoxin system VapC family toxin [Streptosporangiaceae bacterium]
MLDTQLLVWGATAPERFSPLARELLMASRPALWFSAASIWELAIKRQHPHRVWELDPGELRSELLRHHYREVAISGAHALATADLPRLHKDPFDRILLAQATIEGLTLLTTDARLGQYPGPVRVV